MLRCIQECTSCHAVCTHTSGYALGRGGAYASADLIGLIQDCSEICQAGANFMLRASPFHGEVCGLCAEVCTACAEACDRFAEDETLHACAESCRSCAASCRTMAAAGPV